MSEPTPPTSPAPSEYILNYSSDGTNITIPIASLTGLTAEAAHPTTGDIRTVLKAILATVKGQTDLGVLVLGQSAAITVTSEAQNSGMIRTSYTVRFVEQPTAYAFVSVETLWG